MNKEYLDVRWICGRHNIGIVARDTGFGIQAYIGVVDGVNEKEDIQTILDWGSKLTNTEGRGFFPQFKDKRWVNEAELHNSKIIDDLLESIDPIEGERIEKEMMDIAKEEDEKNEN